MSLVPVSRRLAPASLMQHVTWLRPLRDISREDLEIRRWLENSKGKDNCCIIIAYIISHKLTVFMPIQCFDKNKKVDSMHNVIIIILLLYTHTRHICNVHSNHTQSYIKILNFSLIWVMWCLLQLVPISYLNFVSGTKYAISSETTNHHHLIGWEDCNKTPISSSWHIADDIPAGVGGWVVLVNS